MLKKRQFNIVYVTKDNPQELTFTPKSALQVSYDGKEVKVNL